MAAIKYLVPYQLDVYLTEDVTGQNIQNTFYLKSGLQVDTPAPAYGQAVAGASSNTNVLNNFLLGFAAELCPRLSVHASLIGGRMRAIMGWKYPTPFRSITNVIPGAPATLITATPHGLSNSMTVAVGGITSPTGLNGTWLINVVSPTAVELLTSTAAGAYTGGGYLQEIRGSVDFYYEDNIEATANDPGLVAGDMLPPYVSANVRRVNSGVGRDFRSRVGFGPLGEASQSGGQLDAGTVTAINTAFNNMLQFANGGSDSSSSQMYQQAVSRLKAFAQPSTFVSSFTFAAPVSSFSVRTALGSQNSRKNRG